MKRKEIISIRLTEEELERIKSAAELSSYSSYSEFIRRTILIESTKIISYAFNTRNGEYPK